MIKGKFIIAKYFGYKDLRLKKGNKLTSVGYMNLKRKRFPWYVRQFNKEIKKEFQKKEISILGLGMGIGMISHLSKKYKIEYVEPDKEMIEIAKSEFKLPKNTKIYTKTAKEFLENPSEKKYDVIFYDIFVNNKMHWNELDRKHIEKMKKILSKNGIIIANTITKKKEIDENLKGINYKIINSRYKKKPLKSISQNHLIKIKK